MKMIHWLSALWCIVGWHYWIGEDVLQRCKYHPDVWRVRK